MGEIVERCDTVRIAARALIKFQHYVILINTYLDVIYIKWVITGRKEDDSIYHEIQRIRLMILEHTVEIHRTRARDSI